MYNIRKWFSFHYTVCTKYETGFVVLFQVKTPAVSNEVTVLAPENTVASGPSLKEKRRRKPSVSDVGLLTCSVTQFPLIKCILVTCQIKKFYSNLCVRDILLF